MTAEYRNEEKTLLITTVVVYYRQILEYGGEINSFRWQQSCSSTVPLSFSRALVKRALVRYDTEEHFQCNCNGRILLHQAVILGIIVYTYSNGADSNAIKTARSDQNRQEQLYRNKEKLHGNVCIMVTCRV